MKRKDKTVVVGAALIGLATVGTVAITKGIGKAIIAGAGFVGNKVLGNKEDLLVIKKKFDEEEIEEVDDNIEEIVEEKIEEVVNEKVEEEIVNETDKEDEAIKKAQEEMQATIAETARVTRRKKQQ